MDPLTALSLAGTVVQFVDFTCKVLSTTRHVYNSFDVDYEDEGNHVLTVNKELSLVVSDIAEFTAKFNRPVQRWEHLSQDEHKLMKLCQASNNVAAELTQKLSRLEKKGQSRLWNSFRVAIQSAWSKEELADLMSRLRMLKETIESRVLLGLRYVRLRLFKVNELIASHNQQTRAMILDAIQSTDKALSSVPHELYHAGIRRSLEKSKQEERELTKGIQRKILDLLSFPSMYDREDEVAEAYRTTFEWIFRKHWNADQPWDNFMGWLRRGSGVYWINGKAGSGKSTLMRYICYHAETQRQLSMWAQANGLPLETDNFFFWNSGTDLQKSQEGLLRSLLFNSLSKHPQLIPVVFPGLWASFYMESIRKTRFSDQGQLDTLLRALDVLLTQPNKPMNLCLFVDGLDEYDGESGTEGNYEALARLFTRISSHANVKVCVSSRPLVTLQNAFQGLPQLKLQDLTRHDIEYYTRDNLQRHGRFEQLLLEEPERAPTLIQEIVDGAQGVFLWVKLVVRSLLSGLSNVDSISILRKRLMGLPKDLGDLYSHMLYSRIDTFYMEKASEMFQMLRASREQSDISGRIDEEPEPLTALTLSLADDEDLDFVIKAKIEPFDAKTVTSRCEVMETRLLNWTAGLLEIQGASIDDFGVSRAMVAKVKGRVQYMHRTVKDFVEHPTVWETIKQRTSRSKFNPNQSLLRSSILQLKIIRAAHLSKDIWRTAAAAMAYAHRSDAETGNPNTELLHELDRTMQKHVKERDLINYRTHWASFPGTFWDKPAEWHDNFLSLAVQYSLCAYVEEILVSDGKVLGDKKGRPLLDYAINPIPAEQRYPLSPLMVEILLRYGAKPNKEFRTATAWENAMAFLMRNEARIRKGKNWKGELLRWIDIFEQMVDAGANVNASCSLPSGDVSVLNVVDALFMKHLPEDAARLRSKLADRGASARVTAMGKLISSLKGWRKSRLEER
ncbi:hypothetical protein DL98DRAFT_486297 [Cadophora sp. DSE1049]|nr:hypothetical protein DL98DRAFT_486297 [Cadophora sp. DSE1049]